ncbi:MAG: hypothetical protein ABIZ36_02100 [Gemmatimonadaceae bacterium]
MTITAQLVDVATNAPLRIAGRVVSWRDFGNSVQGSFASQVSTTDVSGKATVGYTTSTRAGASHRILVTDAEGSAGGSDYVITIAGPSAKYSIFVGAPVVLAGNDMPVDAYLSDINGNRVPGSGRVVTWSSSGTGGSFSVASSPTDNAGRATVNLRTSATGGVTHVVTAIDGSGITGSTIGILTVAGAQGIVAQTVVVGSAHSCVLDNSSMPSCWGSNESGQLGNGFKTNFPVPVPVSGTLRFVSLAAGSSHTCGISNNGEAFCWGSNSVGQLGNNLVSPGLNATPVSGSLSFVALTAGNAHTCGIVAGGAAYCWGDNGFGQLGTGTTTVITRSFVPLAVQGGLRFVSLSAGAGHTCGIVDGGRAYCWGSNQNGQVGNGSAATVSMPTAVNGGLLFSVLSSGGSHTCGVAADEAAYCWGENRLGQLGDGSAISRATPSRIAGAQRFTSLSAGFAHTCGLEASGAAYCWGSNSTGELGNGNGVNSRTPVPVAGNLAFASIAAGGGESSDYYFGSTRFGHTCGVTVDRTAYCWGNDGFGELGDNSAYTNQQFSFSLFPGKVGGQR